MPKGCTILGIRHRDEEQAKLRRGDVLESKRKVTCAGPANFPVTGAMISGPTEPQAIHSLANMGKQRRKSGILTHDPHPCVQQAASLQDSGAEFITPDIGRDTILSKSKESERDRSGDVNSMNGEDILPSPGLTILVSALRKPSANASKDELRTDFALGYDWADVLNEREEDGAGLFYTTPRWTTLNALHQDTLHSLFVSPASAPDGVFDGAVVSHATHVHSWGKIAVLRDGFDAKAWGETWEYDLSSESGVDDGGSEAGLRKAFAALAQDQGLKARLFHPYQLTQKS
ncbi:hypothetical protein DFH94DRAFT_686615 [Russula ochroleuca]|uniref:Uncharacterized protein n=1 Tax=Russula ochroleuca TaxID=152965 RepID=A0A9P5JU91_9AGAM|nr:hypothetical protein DFH94DRAFT_686615 [Russula ochroleuca]